MQQVKFFKGGFTPSGLEENINAFLAKHPTYKVVFVTWTATSVAAGAYVFYETGEDK